MGDGHVMHVEVPLEIVKIGILQAADEQAVFQLHGPVATIAKAYPVLRPKGILSAHQDLAVGLIRDG